MKSSAKTAKMTISVLLKVLICILIRPFHFLLVMMTDCSWEMLHALKKVHLTALSGQTNTVVPKLGGALVECMNE